MADTDPTEPPNPGRLGKTFRSVFGWDRESSTNAISQLPSEVGAVESLVWFGGMVLLKYIVSFVVWRLPAILQRLFPLSVPASDQSLPTGGHEPLWDQYALLLAIEVFLEALVVVFCIWLRLGRPPLRWHRPRFSTTQFCLILSGMAPVATFAAYIYEWVRVASHTNRVVGDTLDPWSWMQLLLTYFSTTTAIMLFAVVPAIVEELAFRRLIGQGWVSRLGVTDGVLVTSAFFGLSHWYLPHVASSFVMGLFLHLTYLKTRSLTASMLVHFVNNAMWVLMSKNALDRDGWAMTSERGNYGDVPSFLMAGLALLASVVTAVALATTSSHDTTNSPPTKGNVISTRSCSFPLFLLAVLSNASFWWLWIEEFQRSPRFQ